MATHATVRTRVAQLTASLLWFATLGWYFSQYAVAAAWTTPYSLVHNYVSDLGATTCGDFPVGSDSYVCSPLHSVMNLSFVLWGVAWALGAVLFAVSAASARMQRAAFLLIAAGGLGTIFIGIIPETVDFGIHSLAALVQTVALAVGLVLLSTRMFTRGQTWAAWLTIAVAGAAVLGIVATGIAEDSGELFGIGLGIWERISLWPIPVWMATFAIHSLWRINAPSTNVTVPDAQNIEIPRTAARV